MGYSNYAQTNGFVKGRTYVIDTIKVTGLKSFNAQTVISYSGLRKGQKISLPVEKLGDHTPSGILRGGKYSLFEAGTRVPFITYWKGNIKPQVSDQMVSQIDFLNSIASLVGSEIRSNDGVDSVSYTHLTLPTKA